MSVKTVGDPLGTLEEIREMNRDIAAKTAVWAEADRKAKAAKKALESAQADLNEYISGLDKEMPLFDEKPAAAAPKPEPRPADSEAWRAVLLADLEVYGLTPAILEALGEAGITTLGQLAAYTAEQPITDVKGIGQAKGEVIENATIAFWRDHPQTEAGAEAAKLPAAEPPDAGAEAEAAPEPPAVEPNRPPAAQPDWPTIALATLPAEVADRLTIAGLDTLGAIQEAFGTRDDQQAADEFGLTLAEAAEVRQAVRDAFNPPPAECPVSGDVEPADETQAEPEAEADAEADADEPKPKKSKRKKGKAA